VIIFFLLDAPVPYPSSNIELDNQTLNLPNAVDRGALAIVLSPNAVDFSPLASE